MKGACLVKNFDLKSFLKTISKLGNGKWLAISFISLLLGAFIILTSEVREALSGEAELIGVIDHRTIEFLTKFRTPAINALAIDLTAMGSGTVLGIVVFFITSFYFFSKKYMPAIQLLLVGVGAAGLTYILKFYFERSRPDISLRVVEVQGFSYPSGHSLSASAIYFMIAILICKTLKDLKIRIFFYTLFLFLILLVGATRIYLGVHYFSDVLAGILVGVSWASLVGIFDSFIRSENKIDE
jgi:undecaprenyl-diphosphatase